jgi:hypothetical protein
VTSARMLVDLAAVALLLVGMLSPAGDGPGGGILLGSRPEPLMGVIAALVCAGWVAWSRPSGTSAAVALAVAAGLAANAARVPVADWGADPLATPAVLALAAAALAMGGRAAAMLAFGPGAGPRSRAAAGALVALGAGWLWTVFG